MKKHKKMTLKDRENLLKLINQTISQREKGAVPTKSWTRKRGE